MVLEGIPFRFVDTAGLRHTEDLVESMGIARTREQLNKAAFVLLLQAPDTDPKKTKPLRRKYGTRVSPI
jgi:tRNA modification GTPase